MRRKEGGEIVDDLLDSLYLLLLCVSGCIISNLKLLVDSSTGRFSMLSQQGAKPGLQIVSTYKNGNGKK